MRRLTLGLLLATYLCLSLIVALTLWLNAVVGPKPAPTPLKLEPFECGATPVEQDNTRAVPVKYYAIAVVFILFDLEIAFLIPWAVAFSDIGMTGFLAGVVFLAILTVGFAYEWKKGALDWE